MYYPDAGEEEEVEFGDGLESFVLKVMFGKDKQEPLVQSKSPRGTE